MTRINKNTLYALSVFHLSFAWPVAMRKYAPSKSAGKVLVDARKWTCGGRVHPVALMQVVRRPQMVAVKAAQDVGFGFLQECSKRSFIMRRATSEGEGERVDVLHIAEDGLIFGGPVNEVGKIIHIAGLK